MLNDLGLHVFAGKVGRGVHVGDEAEGGHVLAARRRGQPAVDDAVWIDVDALKAEGLHLFLEHPGQVELARGAGHNGGIGIGGRVDLNVLQKAFAGAHEKHLL